MLALFMGEKLTFPLFLKNISNALNFILKYFVALGVASVEKPLSPSECVLCSSSRLGSFG